MSKYASKMVTQAQIWVGKNEANGTHREIIDIYNTHKPLSRGYKVKYTDSWCATFISALAIKTGMTNIIPTECSCQKQIELFKKLGSWVENENRTPNVGDIIYYDWQDSGSGDNQGWSDHVGIVEKVSGTTITIIEGNINNSVGRRNLQVNGRYIRGYGTPKYDKETSNTTLKSIEEVAQEVIDGKWGTGATRRTWLTQAGYSYNLVQSKVNDLLQVSKINYYPKCKASFLSIVRALESIGVDGSFTNRKKIALKNGINTYRGTFGQNVSLLNKLKAGKLKK